MISRTFLSLASLLALSPLGVGQGHPQPPFPVPPAPSNLLPGQTAPKVTDIWVVFKTHCDLGYTMDAKAVNEKFRVSMMDNAVRLMEADHAKPAEQRFKWTIAGWPMQGNILGPLQDPARKAKIQQGLREGAFSVHALPASLHTDSMDLEDMVRGLGFASKVARDHGQPLPISGKMTDVPGHAWVLPTLLSHAGIKFLQIGCNYSNRPILVPRLFWWEGPDGSRVLCNYTPQYGSDIVPPKDWPAKNYLAVVMTHDNEGPPSPAQVEGIRNAVAQMPGVTLHMATMNDFAKAIIAEKPELPVVRGDMVDAWIHGISAMPRASRLVRNARPLLPALEILDTELKAWQLPTSDVSPILSKAYENSMLFGEHSFGAMAPGYGFWVTDYQLPNRFLYGAEFRDARQKGFYTKFESSFADKEVYATTSHTLANEGLKERLTTLAKAVKQDGKRVVVFNSLPWKRSGIVELGGKRYFAKDVPAGGYLTLPDQPDQPIPGKLTNNTLETAHFKVTLDLQRGGISSLIEKSSDRELVDTTSPYALGQFLHETFSFDQTIDYYNRYGLQNNTFNATAKPNLPRDVPYAAISPAGWSASLTSSAMADTITLTAQDTKGIAKAIVLRFTFPSHEPSLQTDWEMTGKEAQTHPEGGWLCYPLAVKDPQFLLGRLGGAMNLAKDQLPGGNRYLYGIESGVSISSPDQSGVGLCALDSPTMSFGVPGLWKYDFDYFPKSSTAFVHLYNNMWNTNFPYWIEGDQSSRVKLWPIKAGQSAPLFTPSWEARVPLLAAAADGPAGNLPTSKDGISVSRAGVLVTAFGPNPDGKHTVLRVWEQAGKSGPLTITLPGNFTEAVPVNLRGEPTGDIIKLKANQLTTELPANAPASFLLR